MEKKYYYSFSDYCKNTFSRKLYRVALDAGMTCPNRDGKIDTRGCIFCDKSGSGDFALKYTGQNLTQQDLLYNHQKANSGDYIAYFQAYTNTYDTPERLYHLFSCALSNPLFAGIDIATRPDCIDEAVLAVLERLRKEFPNKFIWIELGLQTIHPKSSIFIRRGYPLQVFDDCVKQLQKLQIPIITHIIIGLPNETLQDHIQTIQHLNTLHINGIKLQLLHYLRDSDLGEMYIHNPSLFHVLTLEEYIDSIVTCIGYLDPNIVIHRLSGDGASDLLLAPNWSKDKRRVLNQIRHALKLRNITQGSLLK